MIFLLLFKTPTAAIIGQFNSIVVQLGVSNITDINVELANLGGTSQWKWMLDFIPTLMTLAFTAILPLTISWSDRFLGHWTRSEENHSIMRKTFW